MADVRLGRRGDRARARGFTLIEIMIALAVFAVVASSLLSNATQVVKTTAALRDKTIAQWIAANEVNRLRHNVRNDDLYPPAGRSYAEVRMADSDWLVEMEVQETENRDVRRISVEVARRTRGVEGEPVLSYVAFVGRY